MSELRPQRPKKGRTIAWLADLYFRDGVHAARAALEAIAPRDSLQSYRVVRRGEPALRTNAHQDDRIKYESFNPPFWDWPYSVLRVYFDPIEKSSYMHHGGEEILVPVSGRVGYHFYWSAGNEGATEIFLPSPLKPGSIIRIAPQVPHHTWAHGEQPAVAWMIFRDLMDNTAGTNLELLSETDLEVHSRRHLTGDELKESSRYALFAWGISEAIRLRRVGAGISLRGLADVCGIDPAQLSRIENGNSNVSLDTLLRIARCLGMGVRELLPSEPLNGRKPYIIEKLTRAKRREEMRAVLCRGPRHLIHVSHQKIGQREDVDLEKQLDRSDADAWWSWIILDGEAIFDLADSSKELLERDSVLHCRQEARPVLVRALETTEILQVTYSRVCPERR